VASQNDSHLMYEFQGNAGATRVSIDPTGVANDIERARKRAAVKKAPVKQASLPQPAPAQAEVRQAEIAQAEIPAAVVEPASAPREDRKVRVIQLYNLPKVD
jgi:hypothetical protein